MDLQMKNGPVFHFRNLAILIKSFCATELIKPWCCVFLVLETLYVGVPLHTSKTQVTVTGV